MVKCNEWFLVLRVKLFIVSKLYGHAHLLSFALDSFENLDFCSLPANFLCMRLLGSPA